MDSRRGKGVANECLSQIASVSHTGRYEITRRLSAALQTRTKCGVAKRQQRVRRGGSHRPRLMACELPAGTSIHQRGVPSESYLEP